MSTEEKASEYACTVKDVQDRSMDETGTVPKDDYLGLRFGNCSCGVTQTDSMPCIHMVVVTKSLKVTGFNMGNVMPY